MYFLSFLRYTYYKRLLAKKGTAMNFRINCLIVFLGFGISFLPGLATAQEADFFWSDRNIGEGAVNAPLFAEFGPGDAGSLYLYYTTNGPSDSDLVTGFCLDIESTNPEVIQFTSAETFDFDLLINGNPAGLTRLNEEGVGSTGTVNPSSISGLAAFTITGRGIVESNSGGGAFTDAGYDVDADAFLVARIDFVITGTGGNGDQITTIRMGPGSGQIVNGSCTEVFRPTFNCATIQVPSGEPICAGIDSAKCKIVLPPTGDLNNDGNTNLLDVAPFVDAVIAGQFVFQADLNQDESVDLLDVSPFIEELVGNPGKPMPGDGNCDGYINLLDAVCLLEFLIDGTVVGDCDMLDVNEDGEVGLLDVTPLVDLILDQN